MFGFCLICKDTFSEMYLTNECKKYPFDPFTKRHLELPPDTQTYPKTSYQIHFQFQNHRQ